MPIRKDLPHLSKLLKSMPATLKVMPLPSPQTYLAFLIS